MNAARRRKAWIWWSAVRGVGVLAVILVARRLDGGGIYPWPTAVVVGAGVAAISAFAAHAPSLREHRPKAPPWTFRTKRAREGIDLGIYFGGLIALIFLGLHTAFPAPALAVSVPQAMLLDVGAGVTIGLVAGVLGHFFEG